MKFIKIKTENIFTSSLIYVLDNSFKQHHYGSGDSDQSEISGTSYSFGSQIKNTKKYYANKNKRKRSYVDMSTHVPDDFHHQQDESPKGDGNFETSLINYNSDDEIRLNYDSDKKTYKKIRHLSSPIHVINKIKIDLMFEKINALKNKNTKPLIKNKKNVKKFDKKTSGYGLLGFLSKNGK